MKIRKLRNRSLERVLFSKKTFLPSVIKDEPSNKMSAYNMATVFGPTLLWPDASTSSPEDNFMNIANDVLGFGW